MAKRSRRATRSRRTGLATAEPDLLSTRLTLKEALLASTEPEEAAEIRRLEGAGYGGPLFFVGGPETEYDRNQSRVGHLRIRAESQLKAKLMTGELVATGRDSRDPFAPRRQIPADRWRYLEIDYQKSAVEAEQARIIEVEISADGGLHMSRQLRLARLGNVPLVLSRRSFDLLLTLAEAACAGHTFVSLEELTKKHYEKATNDKALGQGIEGLRQHLVRSGVARKTVDRLIINVRGKGYGLSVPAAEIAIS
jgi:DNA-binding winged helix-turn-helix (wHTH) protein